MKIIVNRPEFAAAMQSLAGVIPNRVVKPVLACARLSVGERTLMLDATNLEQFVRVECSQVRVERQGETLANCQKLAAIAKELSSDTIQLELDGDNLRVTNDGASFTLPTMSVKDFPPPPPVVDGAAEVTLPAASLACLIRQTRHAVADASARYAFNGVLIRVEKGAVRLVATDGRRLAHASFTVNGSGEASGIIPEPAIVRVERMCGDDDGDATLRISENTASFAVGASVLVTNLIEGQFPPYEDVIPSFSDHMVTVSRDALVDGVRQASLATDETAKGVTLAFTKSGVSISGRSPESGASRVRVPCRCDGGDITIGSNPDYLLATLKSSDAEEVKVGMNAPNRPLLFDFGNSHRCVVMPVNLQ